MSYFPTKKLFIKIVLIIIFIYLLGSCSFSEVSSFLDKHRLTFKIISFDILLLLSLYFTWLYDDLKNGGSFSLRNIKKRHVPHIIIVFFIITISALFQFDVLPSKSKLIEMPELQLEVFNLDAFRNEISSKLPAGINLQSDIVNSTLRKYDHALHLFYQEDFESAKDNFDDLDKNKDEFGKLLNVSSYAVKNNLGIVYFKLQKNRKFEAFIYLYNGLQVSNILPKHKHIIEKNLNNLDKMVNYLDYSNEQ